MPSISLLKDVARLTKATTTWGFNGTIRLRTALVGRFGCLAMMAGERGTIITRGLLLVVAFLLMQLVPYRVSNPAPTREPTWNATQTRALAVRACYDCHSDEVRTPWYGKIAPVSWWIANHLDDCRAALNFPDWRGPRGGRARPKSE